MSHRCKCRWSSRGRELSRDSLDDPCVETLYDRHHREKFLSGCGSECAFSAWTLMWTSCHNLQKKNEDVFCQIYWITWNLALKWSFAGVRVFMLPEMEMFFFLQFIDRNWLIVRYARIQRWSLHNIVAFSCRMHKSHVTRHSIFATCNLTAAAFHYKCFQRFSKSNLQFCVNFTL